MAGQKLPLGPTGRIVAENIERLRFELRISYAELSRELEEAGRPIPPLGLRRMVEGERRVDSDDLCALARVLGVTPSQLLTPWLQPLDMTEVTAWREPLPVVMAYRWFRGDLGLGPPVNGNRAVLARVLMPGWMTKPTHEELDPDA